MGARSIPGGMGPRAVVRGQWPRQVASTHSRGVSPRPNLHYSPQHSWGVNMNSIHPESALQNQEPTAESRCPLGCPIHEVTAFVRPRLHEGDSVVPALSWPHLRPCPYTFTTALALSPVSLWYPRLSPAFKFYLHLELPVRVHPSFLQV